MKAMMPVLEQVIDGDTRDDRSDTIGLLRDGLLLGFMENGKWKHYDPRAEDGSQIAQGMLCADVDLLDAETGVPVDTVAGVFAHPARLSDLQRIAREEAYKAMKGVAEGSIVL